MRDKKHIDRIFQENFKDFDVQPDNALWSRVSESLPQKKKKRRILPLWWQVGGVAAAIALVLVFGNSIFNSENKRQSTPVVDTKTYDGTITNETEPSSFEGANTPEYSPISNSEAPANSVTGKPGETSATGIEHSQTDAVVITKYDAETKLTSVNPSQKAPNTRNSVAGVYEQNKNDSQTNDAILGKSELNTVVSETVKDKNTAVSLEHSKTDSHEPKDRQPEASETNSRSIKDPDSTIDSFSIEEAIAEQSLTKNEKEKADERSRWSISPNVAPVYFSSLGQGSPISPQFNDNAKGGDINMSYGVSGSYAVSNRLKVRAGVNRVNLNQTTADVFAFEGAQFPDNGLLSRMPNVDYENGLDAIAIMSSQVMNRNTTPELINTKIAGNLEQRFGFIEVPLELEYRLVDRKFGVNVIGGFSTFFLDNNEIFADIDGESTLIGEANNINSTSFSANFGLGMDYKLTKQWNINLEPMFKYQINTFNNTSGEFRPYFIGVYTGLSFKF
jgi:hypothetical protein